MSVVHVSEEEAIAKWLIEMAERGMGLRPAECLDFSMLGQTNKRACRQVVYQILQWDMG